MDNNPADDGAEARRILANWLDDYTAGRCDRAQMQASFLEICRSNPEAPWDALALLDQYQRRGRVDATLARSLKSDIAQLVFGVANQTEEPDITDAQEVDSTTDTTGSRWRRLAEHSAESRKSESFGDPTAFDHDFDPQTRPPHHTRPKERTMEHPTDRAALGSILRGRYELLNVVGRGSAGVVYKALDRHRAHLDHTARCVALRVLKENYRDYPEALAQLEREFHLAQSLSHPNIVSTFDLDRDGDIYFVVMELLDGELLSDVLLRLDRRPLGRDQALGIVGGIGAALAHAHRRNVIHGDLKPAKVMITAAGDVKVLDFGFSRRRAVDAGRLEPWIAEPGGAGAAASLAYASPDRANGEPASSSEDVYSLACIAYELLSGQHPYGGRSGPLARAQGRDPQRISGLSGKQWNALRTALQWSRADRKIDVIELISALGCTRVQQHLSIPQELLPDAAGSERRGWRGPIAVTVLMFAVLALVYWRDRLPLPDFDLSALSPRVAETTTPTAGTPPLTDATGNAQSGVETAPPVVQDQQSAAQAETTPPASDAQVGAPTKQPTQGNESSQQGGQAQQEPGSPARAASQAGDRTKAGEPDQTAAESAQAQAGEQTRIAKQEPQATGAATGPAVIGFDKDTYVATESDGTVRLTIKRTGNTRVAASFHWALLSNSAEAGADFAAIGPETERMAPGVNTLVLTIPLVSDSIKENTELFLVELSVDDDGPELGAVSRAAVIIVDDD
ncbi:MAG TPA: protein kinase [Povalibacter sp.]|nr:protein kinase [Povalibacter sp.]